MARRGVKMRESPEMVLRYAAGGFIMGQGFFRDFPRFFELEGFWASGEPAPTVSRLVIRKYFTLLRR